jgi:Trypsin-co-occurring domain 1
VESRVVTYALDDSTVVRFEIEPPPGFQPASPDKTIGRVQEAIAPAVEAAKVVLDKVKQAAPDEIEVKFGVKVSGKMDWLIAKAATDANFEITLTWRPDTNRAAATERAIEEEGGREPAADVW